jgi:tetratricopeptide (TPR) repeat protein
MTTPRTNRRLLATAAVALGTLALGACGSSAASSGRETALPRAVLLPSDAAVNEQSIRFLERRVQRDKDDFIAHNKLAGYYLQRVRESSDLTYLQLASRAAHASLRVLPAEQNSGGLTALAQVELTSHDFAAAREHALRLAELEPEKIHPYQILGDAYLELGEYEEARTAYGKMVRFAGGIPGLTRVAIEERMSKLAALRGDMPTARQHLLAALREALALPYPPREVVAWDRWQLGEAAFATGDYPAAEQYYRDALTTAPGYFRALVSLGRVRAARGDLAEAIALYERATAIVPDPAFVAELGDLYALAGRREDAQGRYALVEAIGKLSAATGVIYNRQQALFCADHDLKPLEAYNNAAREYQVRRDIYGADAVAWTALKAGKLAEAQAAMREALRLGTQDAKLFYHAGMIARAAGDKVAAARYLQRALALNPRFDALQAPIARNSL